MELSELNEDSPQTAKSSPGQSWLLRSILSSQQVFKYRLRCIKNPSLMCLSYDVYPSRTIVSSPLLALVLCFCSCILAYCHSKEFLRPFDCSFSICPQEGRGFSLLLTEKVNCSSIVETELAEGFYWLFFPLLCALLLACCSIVHPARLGFLLCPIDLGSGDVLDPNFR